MFIAKHNDLIILTKNTREELEQALQFMVYTSIEETDIEYELYNGEYLTKEEIEQKERERINILSMTKREMFLGLYRAKGITPDMLKAKITDPQALIEFDYGNDYYRDNTLIDAIGSQLGFTTEQLDKFFETKDYTCLIPSNQVNEQVEDTSSTGQA